MIDFTYFQLISYNIHIGYSIYETQQVLFCMLNGIKNKICFFNLVKSISILKFSIFILKKLIKKRIYILLNNINIYSYNLILKNNKNYYNNFYYTKKKLPGILTNFFWLSNFFKKKVKLPSFVFGTSEYDAYLIRESNITNIPSSIILDSNINLLSIYYILYGNDKSILAIYFYYMLFFKAIKAGFKNYIFLFNVSKKNKLNIILKYILKYYNKVNNKLINFFNKFKFILLKNLFFNKFKINFILSKLIILNLFFKLFLKINFFKNNVLLINYSSLIFIKDTCIYSVNSNLLNIYKYYKINTKIFKKIKFYSNLYININKHNIL